MGVSYISELVTAKEMELVGNICVMLTIILLTTMVVSVLVSRLVTNPVQRLIRAMEEFEKDAAGYVYQPVEGTTEIEALSQSYEHMVRKIQKLMKQVRQEEISLRKTELKALQAQINPHFLYNTLDSVVWMTENGRTEDAVVMLTSLARFFRISLSRGSSVIPIADELEHARHYLTIQKMRYKNKFSADIQAEDGVEQLYTIKLVIQPVLENAIYHGMTYADGDGEIHVRAFRDGCDVVSVRMYPLRSLLH